MLDMTGFRDKVIASGGVTGWGDCLAGGTFSGILEIRADKNDPGTGSTGFWFTAKGADGVTDVQHHLAMTAQIANTSNWPYWIPAAVSDTATVTGGSWEMVHNNGPGRKIACTGEWTTETLDFTILVTRTG